MTEREFMTSVVTLARLNGWLVYHTWRSDRSEPGFPDLTMVRGRRLLFAELKTEKGRVTAEQQHWLHRLSASPAEVYLWRPSEWQEIERTLARRAA